MDDQRLRLRQVLSQPRNLERAEADPKHRCPITRAMSLDLDVALASPLAPGSNSSPA